jgi:hypothetical protein
MLLIYLLHHVLKQSVSVFEKCVHVFKEMSFYSHSIYIIIRSIYYITCFITTLSIITTLLTFKSYFSSFHLVVVSDDDNNMRFFRKFCMKRRLILLKSIISSFRYKINRRFNSSIINIQSLFFDLIRCEKQSFSMKFVKKIIYWYT